MILTHDPYQPTPDSEEWDPTVTDEQTGRKNKFFADMVAYMDKMIGRLDAKLEELGIRENTLLLFLGDNGTGHFKGADYPGGKGTTTVRGTHVPLIARWPAMAKKGGVCKDLISAADFLPTICMAAGASIPEGIDGVSFLPQLKGLPGTPRDNIYHWYSPRQKANMSVKEFVCDHHFKLYRTGELYDLARDPDEKFPLSQDDAAEARAKLQAALDQYNDVRPAALDAQFASTMNELPERKGKNKKKQ